MVSTYIINTPADGLEAAATEIERRGWTRGTLIQKDGSVCIIGALTIVYSGTIDYLLLGSGGQAVWVLENFVRYTPVSFWNDLVCTSQEQAVDTLRAAAKRWREEHQTYVEQWQEEHQPHVEPQKKESQETVLVG